MKSLQLLFIMLLLSACSGTGHIHGKTANKPVYTQPNPKDSIIENNKTGIQIKIEQEKKAANIEPIETINKEIGTLSTISDANEFNQILRKRFKSTHELWDELLHKHVSDKGVVNYKAFKLEHKKLHDYIHVLSLAQSSNNFQQLSKQDKLAYWINAYNALAIDLILRNYPVKSIKDIKDPWGQRLWKLGEKWYNLNGIEHQILRKMDEPRIHFAIVCASVSCPKLSNEAYTAENLEAQLTKATKDFLNDSERNLITENRLELSQIFQWFAKDFNQNGDLIDFLNQYSTVKISDKAKKSYKDYNWDLNE
ncbi:DUF547 domain-containing protein [Mariniflexile sp.]|uniref:DUF547 domain-containing protein n=1 Tax=Mariniflexile sp. TaxID=1979402 RepID=UPI004047C3F4